MDKQICEIIAKVRQMFKYDKRFKDILKIPALVHCCETKNNGVELTNIIWSFYGDQIIVGKHRIVYSPEHGNTEELITYKNFDELLNM